jgi:hypothetical protein
MNGMVLLLGMAGRGVEFNLDAERCVRVHDRRGVLTEADYVLLTAIKAEIRSLLMVELPNDPGADACDQLDAAEGVAVCRRCARGIAAHFWRRANLRSTGCDFAIGAAGETCRNCGAPVAEHAGSRHAAQ